MDRLHVATFNILNLADRWAELTLFDKAPSSLTCGIPSPLVSPHGRVVVLTDVLKGFSDRAVPTVVLWQRL